MKQLLSIEPFKEADTTYELASESLRATKP